MCEFKKYRIDSIQIYTFHKFEIDFMYFKFLYMYCIFKRILEKTWGILIYYQSNKEKLYIYVLDRILDIQAPHALFPVVMLGDYDDCVFTVVGVVFMYEKTERARVNVIILSVCHLYYRQTNILSYSLFITNAMRQYVL